MTRCGQKCDLYRTPCAPYGIHFRKELQKQKYRSRREHHAEISFKNSKRNHFWDTTRGSVTIKEKNERFIIIKMEQLLPDLIFSYLEALKGVIAPSSSEKCRDATRRADTHSPNSLTYKHSKHFYIKNIYLDYSSEHFNNFKHLKVNNSASEM